MGTALNLTTADALLRRLYPNGASNASEGLEKAPLFGMLKKRLYNDFGGQGYVLPIRLGWGGGVSHTFASAQADYYPGNSKAFLITVGSDYAVKRIDGKARAHMLSDKVSFVRGVTSMLDEAFNLSYQKIEHELFREGYCTKGIAASGTNSVTITLADPNTVFNFHVGQKVVASHTEGSTLHSGSNVITAIDYSAGTLTAGTQWDTAITGLDANDYLYISGDAVDTGSIKGMRGLTAWMPASSPTDTFWGVARTVDSRLGGQRIDLSSYGTAKEIMQRATFYFGKMCPSVPKTYIVPPNFYQRLLMELDSKETVTRPYQTLAGPGSFGYAGVKVVGPNGPVEVFQSIQCPQTIGFALNIEDWFILSAGGEMPRILNFDAPGNLLTVYNADEGELRIGHYSELACDNIANSGRFTIPNFA